jgi:hypothetical protein
MNKQIDWDRLYRVAKILSKIKYFGECWIYPAKNGSRGQIRDHRGQVIYVHRYLFELWNNVEVQGIIRHLCAEPQCVNPAHLSDGTYSENGRDASFPPVLNMIKRLEELGYKVS